MKQPRFHYERSILHDFTSSQQGMHAFFIYILAPFKPLESPKGFRVPRSCQSVGAPWGSSYKRLALQLHPDKGGDPDKFKLMILGSELKRSTKAAHRSCQSIIGGCSLSAKHQTQFLGFVFRQSVFSHVSSDWFFWQHKDCEALLWSFEF